MQPAHGAVSKEGAEWEWEKEQQKQRPRRKQQKKEALEETQQEQKRLAKAVHLGGLPWQAVLLRLAVPGRRPVQEVRGVVLVQEASLGTPSKAALRRIRRMGSPSSGELISFPMHCLAQHQT